MRDLLKKSYSALLITLVIGVFTLSFAARWVSFDGSSEAEYRVTVLSSDDSGLMLQIEVPGVFVDDIEVNGTIFHDLYFHSSNTTQEVGAPALPRVSELAAIPGNRNVRVTLLSEETVTLEGFNIAPYLKPTTDNEKPEFAVNQQLYSTDAFYPGERVGLGEIGIMRGLRVIPVSVVPFSYNPVTRQLVAATRMVVKLDFYGLSDVNVQPNRLTSASPRWDRFFRSAVVNYDQLGIEVDNGTDHFQVKYLIICPDTQAVSIVRPLADFRSAQGLGVEIRVMETGFNTSVQFRDYIRQLYVSDSIEYVLLVGDYCTVNGHTVMPMYRWQDTWSDSWYTMVDPWPNTGNDYLADLAIGRFVYDNDSELQHQIDKTIGYLTNPATSDNWAEHTLLVAHQEQYPQKYTLCKEQIRTYAYGIQTPIFQQGYGGAGYTNNNVINYLNTYGSGILNYRGHGSQTAWWQWGSSGDFNASHINQLTNANKLFVHFDVCCDNMDFPGYNGNCFAESFMKAQYGCLAINGAIIPSYTIPNHDYDKEFYKAIYHEGIFNIGYASNFANITVYTAHGSIGMSNIRTYLWLGDSSIDPWTNTPQQLVVNHPQMLPAGTATLEIQHININGFVVVGAMVCAQNAETYSVGYTNYSGTVNLQFDNPITTDLNLMVTAHNALPYRETITVGGSYNLSVSLTPQNPPIVIPANGGSFTYDASIANNDTMPATFDAWIDAVLPNGGVYGPIILRRGLTANPGASILRTLTQNVPGFAPAGSYVYWGHVGMHPGAIWAEDSLLFSKSVVDAGGENVNGWDLSGWDDIGGGASVAPDNFFLAQNQPNPFNPETTISFGLPEAVDVTLTVYNSAGQRVATLVSGRMPAGEHSVVLDGASLSSGVYFYHLNAGKYSAIKKCVMMK